MSDSHNFILIPPELRAELKIPEECSWQDESKQYHAALKDKRRNALWWLVKGTDSIVIVIRTKEGDIVNHRVDGTNEVEAIRYAYTLWLLGKQ